MPPSRPRPSQAPGAFSAKSPTEQSSSKAWSQTAGQGANKTHDSQHSSEWHEANSRAHADAAAAVKMKGAIAKDFTQYGFIRDDKTGDDIFVLPLSCPAGVLPKLGTRVEFTVCADKMGRRRAEDVVIQGGPTRPPLRRTAFESLKMKSTDFDVVGEVVKRESTYGFIRSEDVEERILVIPSRCPGFGFEVPPLGARVTCTLRHQSQEGDLPFASDVHPAKSLSGETVYTGEIDVNNGNFGFIRCDPHPDHKHEKMFLMPWSCAGHEIYEVGTAVSFHVVDDQKTGRPRAEGVEELIKPAQPSKPEAWMRPTEPSTPPPLREQQGQLVKDMGSFGFIQADDGGGDVFVLPSNFPGRVFPEVGTRLAFKADHDPVRREGGRPKCVEVRIIKESIPAALAVPPWQRVRKSNAHEGPASQTAAASKREVCAEFWRQFCDLEGGGVYDPEEHGAPFLRRFVKTLFPAEEWPKPPSSKQRRTS